MSSRTFVKNSVQPWHLVLCVVVFGYLLLAVTTRTIHSYHWFLLAAIPAAFLAANRGRQFFLDWAPLISFWLVYDRLRLVQPFLLDRVFVETPFNIEKWAFGWLSNGQVPAHAARAWLASHANGISGFIISWAAQLIYFSHLFAVPLLIALLWAQSSRSPEHRERFVRHMLAFAVMSFLAVLIYILIPAAPPWWVSLHGTAQPTEALVAQTKINAAMDGLLIQRMIQNAAQWFAAVPSLHGAYPVLLALLALRDRSRKTICLIALYGAAMWAATILLNQHYVIDLIAGAAIAIAAWFISPYVKYPAATISSKEVL